MPCIGGEIEISNINQTSYYDESCVGGGIGCFIRVCAAGKSTENQWYIFNLPYPHLLEFNTGANNSLTLKWSKCLLYSNFAGYQVSSSGYDGNKIEFFSSNEINDTVANIDNFPFGERTTFYLTTKSKNPAISTITSENAFIGDTAFQYFSGTAVCPYPYDEIYFPNGNNELYRYSTEDFSTVEKLPYGYFYYRFSSNENYLLTQYMPDGNLILYTVPQFEKVGSLSFNHSVYDYAISDNGKAVILMNDSLVVYDFLLKQKQTIPISYGVDLQFRIYISSDGKCIYLDAPGWNDKIYQLVNDHVFKTEMSAGFKFYGFNPFNEKEFIIFSNNHLIFYSWESLTKVKSIEIPAFPSSNIDPVSGYFMIKETQLTQRFSLFGIYDISTGQKVGQLTAVSAPQSEYGPALSYFICNKIIYSPYGYKLKIIE